MVNTFPNSYLLQGDLIIGNQFCFDLQDVNGVSRRLRSQAMNALSSSVKNERDMKKLLSISFAVSKYRVTDLLGNNLPLT